MEGFDKILCCSQNWLQQRFLPEAMCLVSMPDISNYSARQLRKLLLQDLSIDRDVVNKILDRKELKDLAESIVFANQYGHCRDLFQGIAIKTALYVVALILFLIFRDELWMVFRFLTGNFVNVSQLEKRVFVLRKSIKKYRSLLGACAIIISFILDGVALYIQASALLSWIVPYHWPIYRYLWFGIPLPINTSEVMSQYVGSRSGGNKNAWDSFVDVSDKKGNSGWTINAGPMLTLSALRYLATLMENFAARRLKQARENDPTGNIGRKKAERKKLQKENGEVKDPWAAGPEGNSAGRGHGYAANYRNNTEESVKWLLKKSSDKKQDGMNNSHTLSNEDDFDSNAYDNKELFETMTTSLVESRTKILEEKINVITSDSIQIEKSGWASE